jgi:thymidylate kinase
MPNSVIEFVGLPGAGKSTAVAKTIKILSSRGVNVLHRPTIVEKNSSVRGRISRVRFEIRNYRVRMLGRSFRRSIRPTHIDAKRQLRQCYFLSYYLEAVKGIDCDAMLMSQSVIQSVWAMTVYSEEYDLNEAVRFASSMYGRHPRKTGVVLIDVPSDVAAERVIMRGERGNRFSKIPKPALEGVMATSRSSLVNIASEITSALGLPLLTIDGTKAPNENAASVSEWISSEMLDGKD